MGGSSKAQTVGYKYYIGMHMVLCHGPADRLVQIKVDEKQAWLGVATGGSISIQEQNLFGGESREGGVSGTVDIEMGEATQTPNSYLVAKLGSAIPAFRNVVGIVLRQCYVGLNPYLKKWAFRVQRISSGWNGDVWNPSSAAINGYSDQVNFLNLKSDGGSFYDEAGGSIVHFGGQSGTFFDGGNDYLQITHDVSRSLRFNYTLKVKASFASIPGNGITYMMASQNYGGSGQRSFIFGLTGSGGGASYLLFRSTSDGTLANAVVNTASWTPVLNQTYDIELTRRGNILRFFVNGVQIGPNQINAVEPYEVAQPVSIGATADIIDFFHGNIYSLQIINDTSFSDMNPAHIIYECLTNPDWGMGYQTSDIDDASFTYAAEVLYNEVMGMSLLWDKQIAIEEFIKEVVKHIDAALYVERTTGKFALKLIRNDFNENELISLNTSNIQKITDFTRPAFGELTNSVTVTYWDNANASNATVTIQDIALSQMQGVTIGTTIQYPGFTNSNVASRVAQRDLKTLSTPLASCTIYANREASSLNIGDCFKLTWPDYDIENLVMRVTGIAYGDGKSNRVRLTCSQDVYSLPEVAAVTPVAPEWEDPTQAPIAAAYRAVVEAPYYELAQRLGQTTTDSQLAENPNIAYLIASAGRPSGAINARIIVDAGGGYQSDSEAPLDFCPFAILTNDIGYDDTVFAVSNFDNFSSVVIGTHAQIGDELVKIVDVAETSVTVGRGVVDTVPNYHSAGTAIIFWDIFGDGDGTEYVSGETLGVKILPTTGAGALAEAAAPEDLITFVGRALKPYPPGKFQIGGVGYPKSISGFSALSLSWAHRDRLLQTAGDLQDTTVGNIGPEAGTSYTVKIYGETNALLRTISGLTGTTYDYLTSYELADGGIATADPNWSNVSLLLNFTGANNSTTFIDSSPTPKTVNANGNAKISTTWSKYGGSSGYLDGAGDYLSIANSSAFVFTADVTIETWIRFDSLPTSGNQAAIVTSWDDVSGRSFYFILFNNAGTMQLGFGISSDGTSGNSTQNFVNWLPVINTEYHIAVCRSGSNVRFFVNGVQVGTTLTNSRVAYNSTGLILIGIFVRGVFPMAGYLDDLRITKAARYTADFTPPNQQLGQYSYDSRLNGKLRISLESVRSSIISLQKHDYTVLREGYGYNYGELYGGDA